MVINNKLVNYFKDGIEGGNSIDRLRRELLVAGWSEIDINDSINVIVNNKKHLSRVPIITNNIINKKNRPVGVGILSILIWINAGVLMLLGILSLFFFSMLTSFIFGSSINVGGMFIFSIVGFIFFGLMSLFFFFFGRGLWRGKHGWRTFYLIISMFSILSGIAEIFKVGEAAIFQLIIAIFLFWYIGFKKNVTEFFKK